MSQERATEHAPFELTQRDANLAAHALKRWLSEIDVEGHGKLQTMNAGQWHACSYTAEDVKKLLAYLEPPEWKTTT